MELRDEDFENVNPGEPRFFVTDSLYPAQFTGRETKSYSWGEKLIVHWKVFVSDDLTQSQMLNRYYNVKRDKGGRFQFGPFMPTEKIGSQRIKEGILWKIIGCLLQSLEMAYFLSKLSPFERIRRVVLCPPHYTGRRLSG